RDAQDTALPDDFVGVAIEGPSSAGFYFYPVYRVGGVNGHVYGNPIHPDGAAHDWRLEHLPEENGRLRVTLDGHSGMLDLAAGLRTAGARFDRFGILTTRIDGNAQRIYFDDLTYTCRQE